MKDLETVIVEKGANQVATITLNRPEKLNSFTRLMCEEFRYLWQTLAEDEEVNAIVLRAAPGRAFSTGLDVFGAGNHLGSAQLWNKRDPGELLGPKANLCWKPVIAAVHGMCAGGAFYWINEADIVICSEDATFFDPHVTYGMTAALEPIGMRWRIPLTEVLRIALMGNDERVCAETALRISLVTEITANHDLWRRAEEIAELIAQKPSVATQGTVRAIWESLETGRTAGLSTGLKYCLLGNPPGIAEVSRAEEMAKQDKLYTLR